MQPNRNSFSLPRIFLALFIVTILGMIFHWLWKPNVAGALTNFPFRQFKETNTGYEISHSKFPMSDFVTLQSDFDVWKPRIRGNKLIPNKSASSRKRRFGRIKRDVNRSDETSTLSPKNLSFNKYSVLSNEKNEEIDWSFNVNVSRSVIPPGKLQEPSKKGKANRGISLYTEVKGKSGSGKDLYRTWMSVGEMLKKVFGSTETKENINEIAGNHEFDYNQSVLSNPLPSEKLSHSSTKTSSYASEGSKPYFSHHQNKTEKRRSAKFIREWFSGSRRKAAATDNKESDEDATVSGNLMEKSYLPNNCSNKTVEAIEKTEFSKSSEGHERNIGHYDSVTVENPAIFPIPEYDCSDGCEEYNLDQFQEPFGSGDGEISLQLQPNIAVIRDWLIEYCFDKVLTEFSKFRESENMGISPARVDEVFSNKSDSEDSNRRGRLVDLGLFSGLSSGMLGNLFGRTFDRRNDNTDNERRGRGGRVLNRIRVFFDFFGSGNSPRQITNENGEREIVFDSEIDSVPNEESENTEESQSTEQCLKMFRQILSKQENIAKPNLYDVLANAKVSGNETGNFFGQSIENFSLQERRFWGLLSDGGSGDGRKLLSNTIRNSEREASQSKDERLFFGLLDLGSGRDSDTTNTPSDGNLSTDLNGNSTRKERLFFNFFGSGDARALDNFSVSVTDGILVNDSTVEKKERIFFNWILGSGWRSVEENKTEFSVQPNRKDAKGRALILEEDIPFGDCTDSGCEYYRDDPAEMENNSSSSETFANNSTEVRSSATSQLEMGENWQTQGTKSYSTIKTPTPVLNGGESKDDFEIKGLSPSSTTSTERAYRYCTHASQCDTSLNERCITNNTISACDCGRSYVRHPVTRKCETKIILETTLRFPEETYDQELGNSESEKFKKTKKAAEDTMWLLLGNNPELYATVTGVEVTGFSNGSLIIHWNLVFAADNESVVEVSQLVDRGLQKTLKHQGVLARIPLKSNSVTVLSISLAINPCEYQDMNYCSRNAHCVEDIGRSGGFLCSCRKGLVDFSLDKDHPGEICHEVCKEKQCGQHGVCQLTIDGTVDCLCSGWYFGEKCQISGIVVVACTVGIDITVVILIVMWVCCIRKRKQRLHNEDRRRARRISDEECETYFAISSPQLNDVIAMEDMAATKFSRITFTPLVNSGADVPAIRVIPPSYSDVSYSLDSTFDTPECCNQHVTQQLMINNRTPQPRRSI